MDKKQIILNGIETDYEIYTNGKVWSNKSQKWLTIFVDRNGYCRVKLIIGKTHGKLYSVHRLVATAFIANPDNKPDVNHKDGNKSNNDVDNLEWVTKSENVIHAINHKLKPVLKGRLHGMAKYDDIVIEQVCQFLEDGLLTLKEINKLTNVGMNTIYHIIDKASWTHVSCKYNIDNYRKYTRLYTHDDYEKVFSLLEQDEHSIYDISDLSGISVNMIRKIRRRVDNPKYNDLYDKYNIDKYNSNNKKYSKEITNDMIDYFKELASRDIERKYIKRLISSKFNINEEYVKLFLVDKFI